MLFKALCKGELQKDQFVYRTIKKPSDTLKYVQPEISPAYHEAEDCERLHSPLERVVIPEEIRERGENAVREFRKWWLEHAYLKDSNPEAFVMRLNLHFKVDVHDFEIEEVANSGIHTFEEHSITELNKEISTELESLSEWANENLDRTKIFKRFAHLSYLGDTDKPIWSNSTEYSDERIKEVLRYVHPRKMKIVQLLKDSYILTYNPDLQFKKNLLEELGFIPCSQCCNSKETSNWIG